MSRRVQDVLGSHNYELIGELGRGGMGVVYLAQHRKLGRRVAIKTLSPERMAKENSLARFFREAKVFASIRHPHIANLYEYEDTGPVAYLALEYIEGTDLEKERRKGRPWKPVETARIMAAMADALSHTHAKGILHRDIKPGNILIENNTGRSVLTDFGLAKGATDDTLTAAGFAVGTPAYMAPEQITDQFGGKPDGRADLFSLGVVAYEMLTHHHPFLASDDLNTMRNIVNSKHKPLREMNTDIPECLARIIEKLLEKNPRDRHADAEELSQALRECIAAMEGGRTPSPARPIPVPEDPRSGPPLGDPSTGRRGAPVPSQQPPPPAPNNRLATWQIVLIVIAVAGLTLVVGIVLGVFFFAG